jgi:Domain of unknown function (DUF4129)
MGRSRTNTLVLAGVALVVLLGVVAFVARGHSAPSGGGPANRGASQILADTTFTVWFVAMALGACILVYSLAQGRRSRRQSSSRLRPYAQMAILFAVLAIVVGFGTHFHLFHGFQRPQHSPLISNSKNQQRKAQQERERSRTVKAPVFEWPLAAGIFALIVGATLTAFLRARARRSKVVSEVELVQQLRQALDDTLDDLRRESDPRKAVIAAYARMERILGAHGLPRRPSEAPQEYLERVLAEVRVSKPAVERLTELFARAKFSQHQVDPQMKEDAIDALVDLREQIRAIGETVDKPALLPSDVPGTAP